MAGVEKKTTGCFNMVTGNGTKQLMAQFSTTYLQDICKNAKKNLINKYIQHFLHLQNALRKC